MQFFSSISTAGCTVVLERQTVCQTEIVCLETEVQQRPLTPKQHKYLVAREKLFVCPLPLGHLKKSKKKLLFNGGIMLEV